MSEVKTAKYEVIPCIFGNKYKFFEDLSGALIVETRRVKADSQDMMFNADVHNCVKCTPWEMRPHYCSVCGNSVTLTDKECSICGSELQYKEVFVKNAQ